MSASYQIEPELLSTIPRLVAGSKPRPPVPVRLCFLQLFVLPFLVFGLLMTGQFLGIVCLMLFGRVADGRVIDTVRQESSEGSSSYLITYAFPVGSIEYRATESGVSDAHANARPGQVFPVRYLPFAPAYSPSPLVTSSTQNNAVGLGINLFIVLFWDGVVSVFAYYAYIEPLIQHTLYRTGETAIGRIAGKMAKPDDEGGTVYSFHYEFRPKEANAYAGGVSLTKKQLVTADEYADLNVGDLLTILYNPRYPNLSVCYRFGRFAVQ